MLCSEELGISQSTWSVPGRFQKAPSITYPSLFKKHLSRRDWVQNISLGDGSYSHRNCGTEILLLDSQEKDVFLDKEEGLVLKIVCGPILLFFSEEEKKKRKQYFNFHKSSWAVALP